MNQIIDSIDMSSMQQKLTVFFWKLFPEIKSSKPIFAWLIGRLCSNFIVYSKSRLLNMCRCIHCIAMPLMPNGQLSSLFWWLVGHIHATFESVVYNIINRKFLGIVVSTLVDVYFLYNLVRHFFLIHRSLDQGKWKVQSFQNIWMKMVESGR